MALMYPVWGRLSAVRERRTKKPNPNPEAQPLEPQSVEAQSVESQPLRPQPQQPPKTQQASSVKSPRTKKPPPAPHQPPNEAALNRPAPNATPTSPEQAPPQSAQQTDTPALTPTPSKRAPRRVSTPRSRALGVLFTLLGLSALAAASWFLLPIRSVTVKGNHELSALEVKRLAGLDNTQPFGWLYYGLWRAGALRDNAWVEAAHITRRFPDRIEITLNERQPVAWLRDAEGKMTALAADATPLPTPQTGADKGSQSSAQRPLPVISGWGPDRSADALYAAGALSRYNVKSVEYTPTGITIQTDKGTIWSGDRELLLKYGALLEQMTEGSRINLYPWGVSVQK